MGGHRRFFIDPAWVEQGKGTIYGPQGRQIATVLRLKPGDKLALLDGTGAEYDAVITSVGKDAVTAAISEQRACECEAATRVLIAIGYLKGDKAEYVVQKCTELGASDIVLFDCERTVAKPDPSKLGEKLERLRRVAREATEQCGRCILPNVGAVSDVESLSAHISGFDRKLVAWEDEQTVSLKNALSDHGGVSSVAVVIGPEGGLTQAEVAKLTESGARPVSLGKRVLRSETAAIAVCAAVMYELEGEL